MHVILMVVKAGGRATGSPPGVVGRGNNLCWSSVFPFLCKPLLDGWDKNVNYFDTSTLGQAHLS